MKDKTHMINSIYAGKAFDKTKLPFMIKILQKMGIEGNYLNITKVICGKSIAIMILNGESIFSEIRKKTKVSTFTTVIQHRFGSPSYSNQKRKRNKRNPDWKRSKALTVCR